MKKTNKCINLWVGALESIIQEEGHKFAKQENLDVLWCPFLKQKLNESFESENHAQILIVIEPLGELTRVLDSCEEETNERESTILDK